MTVRLVALMSIVLLLSLAAQGLLMGRYQDRVLEEVARTASAASRATLETLEFGPGPHLTGSEVAWVFQTGSEMPDGPRPCGATDDPGGADCGTPVAPGSLRRAVVVRATADGTGSRQRIRERFDVETHVGRLDERLLECTPHDTAETCERLRLLAREIARDGVGADPGANVFIDIEEVSAQAEPTADVVMLRIPTLAPATPQTANDRQVNYRVRTGDAGGGHLVLEPREELRLPIALGDYQTLFQSLRSRALFLFLGVFLVGTVLSTGLAARFTRPIRRLDAGIRRLSEGDLDVEVEVQGRDEIARLGEAFNDMTGKLRANRARAREMVRREKLSALGGLAAGVAHDVRNPLHSIGLTLQHLSDACRPAEPARADEFDRAVAIIRGEIRRLDQLVGNFLQFSRGERRERQPVDLGDLLRETERLIRKEAEWRGVTIELDLLETAPPVSADAETLRASLLNLVMNSFHAMPDGGTLVLRLRIEHDEVVVEVQDSGCGIPAADLENVFEFAYTTREGGNGLGLAMVHECIVEAHGGRIALDSTEGQGTTVRLALPIRPHQREPRG